MKKFTCIVVFLTTLFWYGIPIAGEYPDITYVDYVRNYDGDTVTVNIPNWPRLIGDNISIRVNGIDTPEIRAKCPAEKEMAYEAKEFVKKELSVARRIRIRNPERGKYFRIVGDVLYDDKNLVDELIKRGYGYRYDGGTKSNPWCDSGNNINHVGEGD